MELAYQAWQIYNFVGLALTLAAAVFLRRRSVRIAGWLAEAAAAAYGVATVPALAVVGGLLAWLVLALQFWLVFLALRLQAGRLHPDFLRRSSVRSAVWLTLLAWLAAALWLSSGAALNRLAAEVALAFSLFAGAWFAWRIKGYYSEVGLMSLQRGTPGKPLPSVSLAIPVRNENPALGQCLESVLASDYSKMEVLVYDDCSQDGTSQIIRSYAARGVRFISGQKPAEGWIGKNQAMQELYAAASGQYVIFMGADTRIKPDSIGRALSYMETAGLDMISVVPLRQDGLRVSTVLQQLRYFWQMTLPGWLVAAPVSSAFWCVKADSLQTLGGFAAVRHKIVPESGFAAALAKNQKYRMLIGVAPSLDVTTEKKWSSQAETAIRLLYPLYRRRPLTVIAAAVALAALTSPYLTLLVLAGGGVSVGLAVSAIAATLLSLTYAAYLRLTAPRVWWTGIISFPLLLVQEIILSVASMLMYELGRVSWKGRNICFAVLRRPAPKKSSLSLRPE
ncbi:MAG: glycosyltransferase [Candidatus Chaera renei]|uniref:Glycosyltransferase n=1 Tax=Candidatus Chaera renei TaxID=2506947 RepID=A0A4Q0AJ19_9BACT|nr:MAG: glycosyltransferase [Candidatus Chaera renei]